MPQSLATQPGPTSVSGSSPRRKAISNPKNRRAGRGDILHAAVNAPPRSEYSRTSRAAHTTSKLRRHKPPKSRRTKRSEGISTTTKEARSKTAPPATALPTMNTAVDPLKEVEDDWRSINSVTDSLEGLNINIPGGTKSLLLQADAKDSDSWISISLGGIHYLDETEEKCAVIIQIRHDTRHEGVRCRKINLDFAVAGLDESDDDENSKVVIKDIIPRYSGGSPKYTKLTYSQEAAITEPHSGAKFGASRKVEHERQKQFKAKGFYRCQPNTMLARLGYFMLLENKESQAGVPPSFQGVIFLNSRRPFYFLVKLCADMPGSWHYYLHRHRGVVARFEINPQDYSPVRRQKGDYKEWFGGIEGECSVWEGW